MKKLGYKQKIFFILNETKRKFKKVSFILSAVFSLTVIFLSVYFVSRTNFDIRNLAMSRSNANSLILELTLDPKTHEVKVKDAVAANNNQVTKQRFEQYLERSPEIISKNNENYEIIVNKGKNVIQRQKIKFTEYLQSLPPIKGEKYGDPLVKLPEPIAIVQVDYQSGATFTVQYPTSKDPKPLSSSRIAQAVLNHKNNYTNQKVQSVYNPSPDTGNASTSSVANGYLDILYIASGYSSSNINTFTNDVNENKNYILSLSPYSNYKDRIRAWQLNNLQDLGCSYGYGGLDRCLYCDTAKVLAAAQNSGISYDTIIVINNSTKYGGCAGNFAVTSKGMSEYGIPGYKIGIHEFSHTFGQLNDEYSYGTTGAVGPQAANCDDSSSCSKWSSYFNSCKSRCTYENAYRPSDSCLMLDLYSDHFDPVCQKALTARLQSFTTPSEPTIAPTDTPTPTPTPLQPLLIKVTPTPFIPNCSYLRGPTQLTVGKTGQYQANFWSPAGSLAGEIFYDKGSSTMNRIIYQTLPDYTGTITASFTPKDTGTFKVCCRAWNDSVAECRPSAYVDYPPRYACPGPQVCLDVNVINGPSLFPTRVEIPTPTFTPTPTPTTANNNPCAAYNGSVTQCDAHGPYCAYYYCSNQCWPRGTSNCAAGCLNQCSEVKPTPTNTPTLINPTSIPTPAINNPCAAYNGSVTQCDTHGPYCAYYYCSNQCWPRGTSNCTAGCKEYCN
jgi:hypothetical protein